jgi:hypothetical protein
MLAVLLLVLAGCQEIQGPVWSPDGSYLAYTVYTRPTEPGGRLDTSVYLLDPEDETAKPILLGRDAAYPRWAPEGTTVYFLAHRDKDGFYTALVAYHANLRAGAGALETVLQDPGLRLTGFQLSVDGVTGLLNTAKEVRPGAPQTVEFWNARERKRTSLAQLGEVYSPAL